nr:2-oxo-4-hydroxy-4-carboxy-5-ureidoimidazoline decarboxylase [Hoyosella altamirensis]
MRFSSEVTVTRPKLDAFNALPYDDAVAELHRCCSSRRWTTTVAAARPYASVNELLNEAQEAFTRLSDADYREGVAGHPRIGDRTATGHSSSEQAHVATAGRELIGELTRKNEQYETRFGFVYLVFAHGRRADELLAILNERLENEQPAEWHNACEELVKITLHRLRQLVSD